jgi:hypothetical protein
VQANWCQECHRQSSNEIPLVHPARVGLKRWYVLETPIMLMRFTMPRLFNIAHFQNQRQTAVLCIINALQTRAGEATSGVYWLWLLGTQIKLGKRGHNFCRFPGCKVPRLQPTKT